MASTAAAALSVGASVGACLGRPSLSGLRLKHERSVRGVPAGAQKCPRPQAPSGGLHAESQIKDLSEAAFSRRQFLSQAAILAAVAETAGGALPARAAVADATLKEYVDESDKFSLLVPADWEQGQGFASGQRRVLAFYPPGDMDTNINIIVTGVGADFQNMGSFGTAYGFGSALVGGLDRSWRNKSEQAAKLVDAFQSGGIYYIEYTVAQPGKYSRHFQSAVTIGFNGRYNRLYTVTGQYKEEDKEKYSPLFAKLVASFKL
eukprot:jgi/Chlat1/4651/Chrsp3S05603